MTSDIYKNAINSCIATGIAEIATLPICTLKTNYQNGCLHNTKIIPMAKELYATGGIKAFYRASFPAMSAQMFSTSTKYTLYTYLQQKNDNKFVNGIASGITSSIFTHPLDVIRVHKQMNKSLSATLYQDVSFMKYKTFYKGYSKTFSKIALSSALFFPINDIIKENTNYNSFVTGFVSASISTIIMHPIDYLKTRHVAGLKLYESNVLIYYKGLSLNLLRIVPHFSIVMGVIELLKR